MEEKIQVGKHLMQTSDRVIEIMNNPSPKGPRRCLSCLKPFRSGEVWLRYTAVTDPKHGSYAVGIHEKCRRLEPQRGN